MIRLIFSISCILAYIVIVFLAGYKAIMEYRFRRLIKANFWINVMTFAMVSLIGVIILNRFL